MKEFDAEVMTVPKNMAFVMALACCTAVTKEQPRT
jgi:hypothetical protein